MKCKKLNGKDCAKWQQLKTMEMHKRKWQTNQKNHFHLQWINKRNENVLAGFSIREDLKVQLIIYCDQFMFFSVCMFHFHSMVRRSLSRTLLNLTILVPSHSVDDIRLSFLCHFNFQFVCFFVFLVLFAFAIFHSISFHLPDVCFCSFLTSIGWWWKSNGKSKW